MKRVPEDSEMFDFTCFQNNDTVHNYNNLNPLMNDGAAKDGEWLN